VNLSDAVGGKKHKKRKRIGRGAGSGWGKTAGRGMRGARSRAGEVIAATYEGGQMPLFRRLPKRGFNNRRFQKRPATINVGDLADWPGEEEVNPESLLERGLVDDISNGVKLLGTGDVSRPLTVRAHAFSAAAREKILAAGGKADVIAPPKRRPRRKAAAPAKTDEEAPEAPEEPGEAEEEAAAEPPEQAEETPEAEAAEEPAPDEETPEEEEAPDDEASNDEAKDES
jgi:large subunit ribosomal protein L15